MSQTLDLSTCLIVGLGNPGSQYNHTRHNLGFDVIDLVVKRLKLALAPQEKFRGDFVQASINGHKVFFLKPTTYMNVSGESLGPVARFYKIPLESVLVIHDDLDQIVGAVKFAFNGGDAGHNGIKSIYQRVGKNIWRLKLGIGRPQAGVQEVPDYVLARFRKEEQPLVDEMVVHAADAVEALLQNGLEKAMNRFNRKRSPLAPASES